MPPDLDQMVRNFQKRGLAEKSGDHETARHYQAKIDQAAREGEREMERRFDRIERQADVLWDDAIAQGTDPDPAVVWQLASWITCRRPAPTKPTISTVVVAPRTRRRTRGAGRPRAQGTRSSARSGDSPDDDPEPRLPSGAAA